MGLAKIRTDQFPQTCPACGKAYSRLLGPKRRMQRKALALLWFGLILSAVWSCIFFWVLFETVDRVYVNVVSAGIMLLIVAAPAILLGGIATRMARIATFRCGGCGQSEHYLIDKS